MTTQPTPSRGTVGVVTIIDHANYGNRLQNYAMQRIITGLGYACTTIVNQPRLRPAGRSRPFPGPVLALKAQLRRARRRLAGRTRPQGGVLRQAKKASGRAFTRDHIRETDFTLFLDSPAGHLDGMFDFFVAGSDQVWNPNFRHLSEVDFLTFAAAHKRIAFSASMGVSDIPPEHRDFYRQRLAAFEHISVREEAAADVVRALTGRAVPVTVDPTLILSASDWEALAVPHPDRPQRPYVLAYFLGPRPPAAAALLAECAARGLAVVHLGDPDERAFYAAGPGEFLGLVRDATLHLTDSFHGVIFSTIFGTPFAAFDRAYRQASMGSRLDTLLTTLRLGDRKVADTAPPDLDRLLAADFGHVAPIVAAKAAEARRYLAHALGREPDAGA